ncbi:MAG TPA: monovalent cation/H+ antiporter subunit D [Longimicrobiales bacterium]
MSGHLTILPVLLPFATGVLLLLVPGRSLRLQRAIGLAGVLLLLGVAAALLAVSTQGGPRVYHLGGWPAPFGIVLVLDRLSALMLALTAAIALFSLLQAVQGQDRSGPLYHPLFQLQLVGLNGAFLTGDLFNLFVFFEILLIASYCLLVYGSTAPRLRAGVHYVVLNLAGSSLFLIAVGTLYGMTGTLNMADMARKVAAVPAADVPLLHAAALLLLMVFALKAAVAPLYFWLPSAYAAASAPVAALFAIMTKVGVYAIVRVYTLVFGAAADPALGGLATRWLLPISLITILLGMLGAVGVRELRRMQGYLLIGSIGIMLAPIALFSAGGISAGLYYLVHSTIVMAAMFLLSDLIAKQRGGKDDLLVQGPAVTQAGALGLLFFVGAIAVAGLPPFSGFVGKALILSAVRPTGWMPWIWSLVLVSGLLAIAALSRAGIRIFWDVDADDAPVAVRWRLLELGPTVALLALVLGITVLAGPITLFLDAAAEQLLVPGEYVRAVLGGAP